MSQIANNQGGSFEFPSRPTDPSVVTPPASPDADSQHSEVLSQAKRDLVKAEELIASFKDGDEVQEESSFGSYVVDADRPPGDFAAADPYVNTQDIKDECVNVVFDGGPAIGETTEASGDTTDAIGGSNKETKEFTTTENKVSQVKPGGVTDLSKPQVTESDGNVRTVEEILSTIPSYQPEPETSFPADSKTDSEAAPVAEEQPVANPEAKQDANQQSAGSQFDVPTSNLDGETDQAKIDPQLASGILKHSPGAGEEEVPVSWFAQDETIGLEADSRFTQGEIDSIAGSVSSAIVDPVSGEKQFDVRDFSEMADAKIPPIPNAYNDSDTTVVNLSSPAESAQSQPVSPKDSEKIHSPLSLDTPQLNSNTPVALKPESGPSDIEPKNESSKSETPESEKTIKSIPAMTVKPTKKPFSLTVVASKPESATSTSVASDSEASDSVVPAVAKAAVPTAAAASLAAALASLSPKEEPAGKEAAAKEPAGADSSELGKLAKTPKPTPKIEDSEIAAAFAKCDDIPEPEPDYGEVAEFADETFGESGFGSLATQSDSEKSDDTFLVHEDEVIQIDGNDGYEFIDLACFDRSFATLKPGRIIINDQNNSTFEVQYKNVQYALFADGVRVDLPSQSG